MTAFKTPGKNSSKSALFLSFTSFFCKMQTRDSKVEKKKTCENSRSLYFKFSWCRKTFKRTDQSVLLYTYSHKYKLANTARFSCVHAKLGLKGHSTPYVMQLFNYYEKTRSIFQAQAEYMFNQNSFEEMSMSHWRGCGSQQHSNWCQWRNAFLTREALRRLGWQALLIKRADLLNQPSNDLPVKSSNKLQN